MMRSFGGILGNHCKQQGPALLPRIWNFKSTSGVNKVCVRASVRRNLPMTFVNQSCSINRGKSMLVW